MLLGAQSDAPRDCRVILVSPIMERQPREEDGMQVPGGGDARQGLEVYEQMVDTFAEQAKAYWRLWGLQGEPMVRGIEAWAEMQRASVQLLRQNMGNQS